MNFARDVFAAAQAYGLDTLEVEFRLGRFLGREFVPGVPEPFFNAVRAVLEASRFAKSQSQSVERIAGGFKRVTRPDGSEHFQQKNRLTVTDMPGRGAVAVRGAVSLEVSSQTPPADCHVAGHDIVRRKNRRSYTHKGWTVDMTVVTGNANLDDDTPQYEIEVELSDPGMLYEYPPDYVVECGQRIVRDLFSFGAK